MRATVCLLATAIGGISAAQFGPGMTNTGEAAVFAYPYFRVFNSGGVGDANGYLVGYERGLVGANGLGGFGIGGFVGGVEGNRFWSAYGTFRAPSISGQLGVIDRGAGSGTDVSLFLPNLAGLGVGPAKLKAGLGAIRLATDNSINFQSSLRLSVGLPAGIDAYAIWYYLQGNGGNSSFVGLGFSKSL